MKPSFEGGQIAYYLGFSSQVDWAITDMTVYLIELGRKLISISVNVTVDPGNGKQMAPGPMKSTEQLLRSVYRKSALAIDTYPSETA